MPYSRSLLLKGLAGASAVTLGGLGIGYRENIGNFFSGKEKAEKVREGGGREIINEKLKSLGLEGDCLLEEAADASSFSRECSMDEGKLKKINFSNRGKEELKISEEIPENLKLRIDGTEGEISFSFTGVSTSSPVTIFGDKSKGKIVINSKDQKFRDVNGQLTKGTPNESLRKLNEQLGKINAPIECRFDESEVEGTIECPVSQKAFKTLEFSNKEIKKDLKVVGWPSGAENISLKVVKDQENAMSFSFPNQSSELKIFGRKDRGKIVLREGTKFKVNEGKLTKENRNPAIDPLNEQLRIVGAPIECRFDEAENEGSVECVVSKEQFMELGFSGKTGLKIEVKNWPDSGPVKLKAEKDSQNAMSLSFTGLNNGSNPTTIYREGGKTIINTGTKFTVVKNQLTKQSGKVDEVREKFNELLGEVNVPLECRFDVMETEESVECDVSKEQLVAMAFSAEEWEGLTLNEKNLTEMKLKVQIIKILDSEDNEEFDDMILTFKDYKKTVKVMKEKKEIVSLVKGTNPEFGIYGEVFRGATFPVLGKAWKPKHFEDSLGLDCSIEEGATKGQCTFVEENKKIKVGKGAGDEFEELTIDDTNGKSFELYKDVEDYNQGYRFAFKGTTVPSGGSSPSLDSDGNYELKWKKGEEGKPRTVYLAKKAN